MLPQYDKSLGNLDALLAAMIERMNTLSVQELHAKQDVQWSAAQVFQHLYDSERATTLYLKKKLQTPPAQVPSGGLGSAIRALFLSKALKSRTNQFRVPKGMGEIMAEPDYHTLKTNYHNTRIELRKLLEDVDSKRSKKAYFKHPRAGRLTIGQTLGFLEDHFERHFDQVKARTKL